MGASTQANFSITLYPKNAADDNGTGTSQPSANESIVVHSREIVGQPSLADCQSADVMWVIIPADTFVRRRMATEQKLIELAYHLGDTRRMDVFLTSAIGAADEPVPTELLGLMRRCEQMLRGAPRLGKAVQFHVTPLPLNQESIRTALFTWFADYLQLSTRGTSNLLYGYHRGDFVPMNLRKSLQRLGGRSAATPAAAAAAASTVTKRMDPRVISLYRQQIDYEEQWEDLSSRRDQIAAAAGWQWVPAAQAGAPPPRQNGTPHDAADEEAHDADASGHFVELEEGSARGAPLPPELLELTEQITSLEEAIHEVRSHIAHMIEMGGIDEGVESAAPPTPQTPNGSLA